MTITKREPMHAFLLHNQKLDSERVNKEQERTDRYGVETIMHLHRADQLCELYEEDSIYCPELTPGFPLHQKVNTLFLVWLPFAIPFDPKKPTSAE